MVVARKDATSRTLTSSPGRLSFAFIALGVVSALLFVLDSYRSVFYQFQPEHLHALAKEAIAAHGEEMPAITQHIITELAVKYPSWTINTNFATTSPYVKGTPYAPNSDEWVFNNAAGAMGPCLHLRDLSNDSELTTRKQTGTMFIIHASITEYLIIFGTALGTEGHSGRHTADDYFIVLQGEEQVAAAGMFEPERFPAGTMNHMRRNVVKQYTFKEGGFALEYARGWIPPMLPMGFADTFSSTLDFITLYHTVRITGREMIKNLLHGKV